MEIPQILKKQFVLFVIMLFVLIPVYVSDTMAADIIDVKVTGAQGVPFVRAKQDIMKIDVMARAPELATLSDKLVLLEESSRPFSCQQQGETAGVYNCTYTYPETTIAVATLRFTLQILNEANNPISPPAVRTVLVDYKAPAINNNSFDIGRDENGSIVANFHVQDEACDSAECLGRCSGISKVEFKVGNSVVGSYANSTNLCDLSEHAKLSLSTSGTETFSVCMLATDMMQQVSNYACRAYTVDNAAPALSGNVAMYDKAGSLVTSTYGMPISLGHMKFNLTEDVEVKNASVDLIGFNPTPGSEQFYENRPANCDEISDGLYSCTVGLMGLFLIMPEPGDVQVRIVAEDDSGNVLDTTVNYPILFDNTPPRFVGAGTDYIDLNGMYWVNQTGFSVYAVFDESGSGMSKRKAVFDFTEFGPQLVTEGSESQFELMPNNCSDEGSIWMCTWKNLQVQSGLPAGSVLTAQMKYAEDDAGNVLAETGYGIFSLDNQPPEVLQVNVTPIGETGLMEIGEGDKLLIMAFVQDNTPVTALGNFSEIIELEYVGESEGTGNESTSPIPGIDNAISGLPFAAIPGECILFEAHTEEDLLLLESLEGIDAGQDLYLCAWTTDPVLRGYHSDADYWLTFTDLLGNSMVQEEEITIYRKLNESEMADAYWQLKLTSTGAPPSTEEYNTWLHPTTGLDRFVWGIGSQAVYQEFELNGIAYNPQILFVDFGAQRCWEGLEYLAHDDETGDFAINILGYDVNPYGRHDVIMMMTNPIAVPEVEYENQTTNVAGNVVNSTINVNHISVSCQMGIVSIVDFGSDRAITTMEIKNFSMIIPVYNNPLGENLDNVNDMIEDLEHKVTKEWGKWLTVLRTIFEYMEAICGIIGTFISIFGMMKNLVEVFRGTRDIAKLSVVGSSAATVADSSAQGAGASTTATSEGLDGNLVEKAYAVLCGLLVQCKISQGKVKPCPESDTWCKFRTGWHKYNQFWINLMSGNPTGEAGEDSKAAGWISGAALSKDDFDPKRSILSSVLTGCIPGIIYNLEKQRQLYCRQLLCYKTEVPYGTPIAKCDLEFARGTCIHWIGQIFFAIPWFQYMEQISGLIQDLLNDPGLLITGYVLDIAIDQGCKLPETPTGVCTVAAVAHWGLNMASNIMNLVQSFKGFSGLGCDFCEEALKDEPDATKVKGCTLA